MAKLYEIVGELQDFIEANEGLEDEQAYKDTLEALQGELNDKVSQWGRAIKNMESDRDAIKAEADRQAARAKAIDNSITRMKETLLMYLKAAGVKKAGDNIIGASIVKNGGKAPIIMKISEDDIPKEYQQCVYRADKEAIRNALESGTELEWAYLGERGEHIKIG